MWLSLLWGLLYHVGACGAIGGGFIVAHMLRLFNRKRACPIFRASSWV